MSATPLSEPAGSAPPLRTASARGFVYTGGRALFNRTLSLVSFVILGRLLDPKEYGLVAIANVFVSLLTIFAASGYSQALVQRAHVDHEDLDTIFWIGLLTSIGLALIMCALAWPLADVYNEPQLRPVLQVLSVTFVFVALGSTHQAVLQRRLDFKALARAAVIGNVVATIVGVAFAFLGFGAWSLVVQTVLGSVCMSLITASVSGYRPRFHLSMQRFWPMFEFSRNYLGSSLLLFTNQRTDDFLIGGGLGATALGVYSVAFRILAVMVEVLSSSVRSVAFPVFARMQGDKPRLLRAYISATRTCAVVSVPAFLFSVAAAPEMIHVAFGAKWDAAVPIMRILCVYGAISAVLQFNSAVLQSLGKARTVLRFGVIGTILQVITFLITVHFGLAWVAASYVICAYLMAPLGLTVAARALDSTVRETVGGLLAPLVCTAIMLASIFALRSVLGGVPDAVRLLALVVCAAVVYLAALRTIGRTAFDETVGFARTAIGGRRRRAAASAA
jgi:O-antigen/teichoic acid export membrane protein